MKRSISSTSTSASISSPGKASTSTTSVLSASISSPGKPSSNSEKVSRIQTILDKFYPPPLPVPLNHGNPYQFLVAVVLSAQTTDGKVNDATNHLFAKVKTPIDMVNLGESEISNHIKSLGLYKNKSKFLYNLSVKLSETALYAKGTEIPRTKEELTNLPGVGNKTASVVLSQVYGIPNLAVDTHVHRLALRWGLTKEKTNASKVQEDLEALFPREVWNKTHLQMIYFGREYCAAKQHDSRACPICSSIVHGTESSGISSASPHKGIVFYAERQAELRASPGLTLAGIMDSPIQVSKKSKKK